ncbi:MAG: SpoIVB peptidase [Sarcina sp.]
MRDGKQKVFIKNLTIIVLLLSSVFALSFFVMNNEKQEMVSAAETCYNEKMQIYAGGDNIGIKISTKGVLVVAFSDVEDVNGKITKSPAQIHDVEIGDIITSINGKKMNTSKDLAKIISECDDGIAILEIVRNGKELSKNVVLSKNKNNLYKLGMWVRDSTAGIGTMTFIDKNTGVYGGLGHPITDSETETILTVEKGSLIKSTVVNVRKGEIGSPGELKGMFNNEKIPMGTVGKNTTTGIFGVINEKNLSHFINSNNLYEIAHKNEIKMGSAQIITTIDESGPKFYDINIEKILDTTKGPNKNMLIKITDPVLLEKTGGIVQGMSGSPIIQNGKIIGAVTHVLVNKPNIGYGIYIENMLKDANLLK